MPCTIRHAGVRCACFSSSLWRHMGGLWWCLYLQGEVLPCPACLLHQVVQLPFTLLITWFLLLGHNFSATRVILLPYYHGLDILYQLAVNCDLWHCNSNRNLWTYAVRYCPSFKIKDELSPASWTITEFHLLLSQVVCQLLRQLACGG